MESIELKELSTCRAVGKPHAEAQSPVMAVVLVESDRYRKSQSVRDADELSDEEADAFFFV